jgi:pimeloyl-ACP methyl ester carboxylesterase
MIFVRMRSLLSATFLGLLSVLANAQRTDTLRFHSAAFGTERNVVVHVPEFHRYASAQVRMPVIILLDGQHEWFTDPVLNDLRFLQYTHVVPQAIVVSVPHTDRVLECATDSITQPAMPLLDLLVNELPPLLEPYHPGDLTVLVGHSFTASFALYAYVARPGAFDAVVALSPLHQVGQALPLVTERLALHPDERVLLAVGGAERIKDGGHHGPLLKAVERNMPERAEGRLVWREYPSAGHTSLPIIAFPELLSTYFAPYSLRDTLAPVDGTYRISTPLPEPDAFVRELRSTWGFMSTALPGDLAELNGMLSRLGSSDLTDHVVAVSRLAVDLYPKFYLFHAWLGEALLPTGPEEARQHLRKALALLEEMEPAGAERDAEKVWIEELLK